MPDARNNVTADGYCRSEAICAILLQKKKHSRRVYARVMHVKTNCDGFKDQGITYPSGEIQQCLLQEFYEECDVDPASLAWIEAHGTGTRVPNQLILSELVTVHPFQCSLDAERNTKSFKRSSTLYWTVINGYKTLWTTNFS